MPHVIKPDWPAPESIFALSTTRLGGAGAAPYDSFNLGTHVGDIPAVVQLNRVAVAQHLPAGETICWLNQVHGTAVVEAADLDVAPEADAVFSRSSGIACAVMTADCLPVLLCSTRGDVVAAAHAGWRGLSAGVLEETITRMDVAPGSLLAWLGPAIGPRSFEVGPEVREAFLAASGARARKAALDACFLPDPARKGYFHADLYGLARLSLAAAGVGAVYGGGFCTFAESDRFFSYRRDGQTGRMASLILIR